MDSSSTWVWRQQSCPQGTECKGSSAWAPLWLVLFTLLKRLLDICPVVHSEDSKIALIVIKYIPGWLKNQDLRIYSVIRCTKKSLLFANLCFLVKFMQNFHYSWWQVALSAVPVPSRRHKWDSSTLTVTPLGQLAMFFLPWNNCLKKELKNCLKQELTL